jgi:protein phosphatase
MFANTDATGDGPAPDIVVYGDIHAAYIERKGKRVLANAGSVGNPLDEPSAAYLILTAREGVHPEIVRVPYDIEREIALAARLGMPDFDAYAIELRTALYRGLHSPSTGRMSPS